MRDRRENDLPDPREAKVTGIGRAFAEALLRGDEVAAEVAVREALEAGMGTAEVDDEIIAPALWFVGELWERGEISVADEHIATEISLRVLALQREARRVARSRVDRRVMLATPAGEQHVVALRMIGSLLRDRGLWRRDGRRRRARRGARGVGAPAPAGCRLPERDDAGRGGPGADRDPRGPAAVPGARVSCWAGRG